MSNVLEDFLNVAMKHSNGESYEDWTRGVLGNSGYSPWCALFVCACAKSVGVLGSTIANVGWVDGIMQGTANLGGTLHSATNYTPKPGDLFSLHSSGSSVGYHVGIVYSVSGNSFTSCEGNHVSNTSGKNTSGYLSGSSTYTLPNSMFYQFCTPDWTGAGGSYSGLTLDGTTYDDSSSSGGGALYSSEYTRADALIREVGFLDSGYNPTLVPSKMRLCVMNYTSMLSDLWDLYGYNTGSSNSSDNTGTVSDGTVTNKQQKVVNSAKSTPNSGASLCGLWIANVFNNANLGQSFSSYDACGYYSNFCKYSNKSQLKPGMIIAVDAHANTYMGSIYGHVGIYVGDNMVYAGGGSCGVLQDDLDWWISYYTTTVNGRQHSPKWGWAYNIDLTK